MVLGCKGVVVECCEYLDDGWVEVSAALARDLSGGFVDWPGLLVGSSMGECVEYISHRDYATRQGDRVSRQSAGVTVTVPALVV
jgi:hypothetical protein